MMPDAFAHALTGNAVSEYTIASTSQLLDVGTRSWSDEILGRIGLDRSLFGEIVQPRWKAGVYSPPGLGRGIDVILPASHDTASAVAAVPATGGEPWAFVSSGTWSLVGMETREPVISEEARAAGLTNEGGVDGTYRLLTNVIGLWLIQECQRSWERRGMEVDIARVCAEAARAPRDGPLIDPDDDSFFAPADMPQAISEFWRASGQGEPKGIGRTARCVFESLAFKTRAVIEALARLTGRDPRVIHIVGGGSMNDLLCRMTADATGRLVVAGPAEATAAGNLLVQARAAGRIGTLPQLRAVVAESFDLRRYEPSGDEYWSRRYERFQAYCR
jgi:rhamnulokinase